MRASGHRRDFNSAGRRDPSSLDPSRADPPSRAAGAKESQCVAHSAGMVIAKPGVVD